METTMKKTTSPIVREYKIGDITYIVKAVVKDGAKEDAVTKVRRLIQNDLRGKKVTNNFRQNHRILLPCGEQTNRPEP